MNQSALAFRTIDDTNSGKVSRSLYLEKLASIIETSEFSCPSLEVLERALVEIASEQDGETVMFNEFCYSLFSQPELEDMISL